MKYPISEREMAMYKPCERIVGTEIIHGAKCACTIKIKHKPATSPEWHHYHHEVQKRK